MGTFAGFPGIPLKNIHCINIRGTILTTDMTIPENPVSYFQRIQYHFGRHPGLLDLHDDHSRDQKRRWKSYGNKGA